MFERFTERARQVVVFAQDEARGIATMVGTSQILIGLLKEQEGLAAQVLNDLGLHYKPEMNRGITLPSLVGDDTHSPPFTKSGKRALELSLREALALGHNYIGTEHILLGLLRVAADEPEFEELLKPLGEDYQGKVRDAVIRRLTGPVRTKQVEEATHVVLRLPPSKADDFLKAFRRDPPKSPMLWELYEEILIARRDLK